jgi:hypothetical protein
MNDGKALLKQLSDARTARTSVYLNAKRIDELYRQEVTRIGKVIASEELGPEFAAGLGSILGVKLSAKKALSSEYEVSPADKALLIELVERRNGQLYEGLCAVEDSVPRGAMVYFLGECRITSDSQDVTPESTGLPAEIASVIHQRRIAQAKGSKQGTIVWTSTAGKYLAAIAYLESVIDIGHIYSYPEGHYGILGRKESEADGLFFVAPVWIWYE